MDDTRFVDNGDLPLLRDMLQAASEETAPADVRRHALASLGLLVIAPSAAVCAVGTVGANVGTTASAVGKSFFWQGLLPKAALLLGLGGTAVGGAVVWEQAQVPPKQVIVARPATQLRALPARSPSPEVAPAALSEPMSTTTTPQAVSPKAKPAATTRRVAGAVSGESKLPASSVAEAKRATSIREEIDLLDRARSELRRGAPAAAMAVIREYFARYPAGEFGAEAELVRREAQRAVAAQ